MVTRGAPPQPGSLCNRRVTRARTCVQPGRGAFTLTRLRSGLALRPRASAYGSSGLRRSLPLIKIHRKLLLLQTESWLTPTPTPHPLPPVHLVLAGFRKETIHEKSRVSGGGRQFLWAAYLKGAACPWVPGDGIATRPSPRPASPRAQ